MTAASSVEPIAIVGLAVQLPDGKHGPNLDLNGFAKLLYDKQSTISSFPPDRFRHDGLHGKEQGTITPCGGGFLSDIDALDFVAHGLSNAEFQKMTPAALRMTDVCHQALVDSGLDYRRSDMGCFAGAANPVASYEAYDDAVYAADEHYEAGVASCMLANRISYLFDLRGPSFPIETACSSAATAIHVACQSIRSGECSSALVGTTNTIADVESWVGFSRLGVLAPDAVSHVFDDRASGYVRAEAAAAVVLKSLGQAEWDGDRIYATIPGSAVNSNGNRSLSLVAPSAAAQQECVRIAMAQAGRSVHDLTYWEMHGTGTRVGDSTELNGFGDTIFGKHARQQPLPIGSVKSSVGHTELAAGTVSLIKLCIMLRDRVLLPNLHFEKQSSVVHWERFNFEVVQQVQKLPNPRGKRPLMGLTSSGFGGVNACIIVEGYDGHLHTNGHATPIKKHPWQLLCVGGLTPRAVQQTSDQWLPQHGNVDLVAMAREMRSSPFRSYAVAKAGPPAPATLSFSSPRAILRTEPLCTLVFSGQGTQHFHMARSLYSTSALFRASIDEGCAIAERLTGHSLTSGLGLFQESWTEQQLSVLGNAQNVWPIEVALLATCVLQMALFDLLLDWNVQPGLLIGHSAGETAVYYASGACDRTMTLEIVAARARAFKLIEGQGSMAYLHGEETLARRLVAQSKGEICIGGFNGQAAFLLSGSRSALEEAVRAAKEQGASAGLLRTNTPIHSPMVDLCRQQYLADVDAVFARHGGHVTLKRAVVSTVTAMRYEAGHRLTASDVYANARQPVQFTQAVNVAISHARAAGRHAVFVEVGAHPALGGYLTSNGAFQHDADVCVSLLRRGSPASSPEACADAELAQTLEALGTLLVHGVSCGPLQRIMKQCDPKYIGPVRLRSRPERRVKHAHGGPAAMLHKAVPPAGPLCAPRQRISQLSHPDLAQHVIDGSVIMPATGFCEIGFELGAHELRDVDFLAPLNIPPRVAVRLAIEKRGFHFSVRMSTELAKGAAMSATAAHGDVQYNRVLCRGLLVPDGGVRLAPPMQDLGSLKEGLDAIMDHNEIYQLQTGSNNKYGRWFDFGPKFRRVEHVWYSLGKGHAVGRVQGNRGDLTDTHKYRVHPAYLDAAGQVSCPLLFAHCADLNGSMLSYFLPSFAERVRYYDVEVPETFYASVRLIKARQDDLVFDVVGFTLEGKILFQIDGFSLHRIINTSPPRVENLVEHWQPYWNREANTTAEPVTAIGALEEHMLRALASGKRCLRVLLCFGEPHLASLSELNSMWERVSLDCGIAPVYVEWIVARHMPVQTAFQTSEHFTNTHSGFSTVLLDEERPFSNALFDQASFDAALLWEAPSGQNLEEEKVSGAIKRSLLPGGLLLRVSGEVSSEGAFQVEGQSGGTLDHDRSGTTDTVGLANQLPRALAPVDVIFEHCSGNEHELASQLQHLPADRASAPTVLVHSSDCATTIALGRSVRHDLPDATVVSIVFDGEVTKEMRSQILDAVSRSALDTWFDMDLRCTKTGQLLVPRLMQRPAPMLRGQDRKQDLVDGGQCNADDDLGRLLAALALEVTGFDGEQLPERSLIIGKADTVLRVAEQFKNKCICVVDSTSDLQTPSNVVEVIPRQGDWSWQFRHESYDLVVSFLDIPEIHIGSASSRLLLLDSEEEVGDRPSRYVSPRHEVIAINVAFLRKETGHWSRLLRRIARRVAMQPEEALRLCSSSSLTKAWESMTPAPDARSMQSTPSASTRFRGDAWYLIVGGVGGLGVRLARFLFEGGARHICLTSRSGDKNLYRDDWQRERAVVEHLYDQKLGLELCIETVDATDSRATESLLRRLSSTHPIAGLAYLPVTLTDGAFPTRTEHDFQVPRQSKILGLQTTLAAIASCRSQDSPLDFVLAASSLATVAGSPGQSTYTVANAELEHYMKDVPNGAALVVIPLLDGGVYRRTLDSLTNATAASQMGHWWGVTVDEYLLYVDQALRYIEEGTTLGRYLPRVELASVARSAPSLRLGHLIRSEQRNGGQGGGGSKSLYPTDAVVAEVLDMDEGTAEPELALTHFGLDSISSIRLANRLRSKLNLAVPQVQLLFSLSLKTLRERYEESLREKSAEEGEQPSKEVNGHQEGASANDSTKSGKIAEQHPHPTGTSADDVTKDRPCQALPLNTVAHGTPAYAIPGAGGGASTFEALAAQLDYPLILLAESPVHPPSTFEALIGAMLEVIFDHESAGSEKANASSLTSPEPIRLCGFSFGASVAMLLARALEQRGRVCDVVLIDHVPIASFNGMWLRTLALRPEQRVQAICDAVTSAMEKESGQAESIISPALYTHLLGPKVAGVGKVWQAALCRHATFLDALLSQQVDAAHVGEAGTFVHPPPQIASPVTVICASEGFLYALPQKKDDRASLVNASPHALSALSATSVTSIKIPATTHFSVMRAQQFFDFMAKWSAQQQGGAMLMASA